MRPSLQVKGIDVILGNYLAGGKVMPWLKVIEKPDLNCQAEELSNDFSDIFPACAVTRTQSRKTGGGVELSNSIFAPLLLADVPLDPDVSPKICRNSNLEGSGLASDTDKLKLPIARAQIVAAQKEDSSLLSCFASAVSPDLARDKRVANFIEDDLLMHKW